MNIEKICEQIKIDFLKLSFIDRLFLILVVITSYTLYVLTGSLLDTTVLHDHKIIIYYIAFLVSLGNIFFLDSLKDIVKDKINLGK